MPNFDMPLQGGGMRMNVGAVPMALLVRSNLLSKAHRGWSAIRGSDADGRGGSGAERWGRGAVQAARGDPPVRHRPRRIWYAMPRLCAPSGRTVSSETARSMCAVCTRSAHHSRSVAASLCARRQRSLPLRHRRAASPAVGLARSLSDLSTTRAEESLPNCACRSKSNYLIFGRMDPNTGKLMTRNGSPDVWTQPISNVRETSLWWTSEAPSHICYLHHLISHISARERHTMGGRAAHDRGHRQHAYSHAPAAAHPRRSCDHQLSSFSQGTATLRPPPWMRKHFHSPSFVLSPCRTSSGKLPSLRRNETSCSPAASTVPCSVRLTSSASVPNPSVSDALTLSHTTQYSDGHQSIMRGHHHRPATQREQHLPVRRSGGQCGVAPDQYVTSPQPATHVTSSLTPARRLCVQIRGWPRARPMRARCTSLTYAPIREACMRRATGRTNPCSTTPPSPSSTLTHIAMNTPSSSATVRSGQGSQQHDTHFILTPSLPGISGDGQIHTFDTRMQRTTQVFQVW